MTPGPRAELDAELARVVRREAGIVVAHLRRRTGDFDVAEEAVQEALVEALRTWPTRGVPPNPAGWLTLTAQRRAVDLLRARSRQQRLAGTLADRLGGAPAPASGDDERLPMLFACCHPSLAAESRLALTLRAVLGLTTAQVSRAFLVPEPTMAQRLVRAKRKIVAAGIPFAVPEGEQLAERLDDVLTVVCLAYNAGYLDPAVTTGGTAGEGLAADAVWLADVVARALPRQAEAWGLLALLTFLQARDGARFGPQGTLVPLPEQDRSRWDAAGIARADGHLERAASLRSRGRFQLQAAIAGCHAAAATWGGTDWLQILTLYDLLLTHDPSPVVRLNQAVALSHVRGPQAALDEVDALAGRLDGYHLLHATRAQLLGDLGRHDEARAANERALAQAPNPAEQALLRERLLGR